MKCVRDVMSRDVEVMGPETSLSEAAEQMRALNVGFLPICENGRLVGVLTDRDIVVRALAIGHDPTVTRAGDIMTPRVEYCFADTDVEAAAELMGDRQIRRLLVLDDRKRLVGVVSLGDLSREAREAVSGRALEEVSEPAAPLQ